MSTGYIDNPYLEQEVLSASPAKLRYLLIDKAYSLCGVVDQLWKNGDHLIADQWLLRIRDILTELLSGVTDREMPLSKNVSDIYIFMINLLTKTENSRDPKLLADLRSILEIERETWQLFCRNEVNQTLGTSTASNAPAIPPSVMNSSATLGGYTSSGSPQLFGSSGFSLEV